MRWRPTLLLLALAAPAAADPPVPVFDPPLRRPLLWLRAPRRFVPGEPAHVELLRFVEAPVTAALYRLHDVAPWAERAFDPAGVTVARSDVGAEAEALLQRDGSLPRCGDHVDFLRVTRLPTSPPGARPRPFELGGLPSGLYLVRVHAGGWAASTVVVVSGLTSLVRRGDTHDIALVTDGDGAPQPGVRVTRRVEGAPPEHATTASNGEARFPAVDAAEARFVAARGDDVAWADATWARGDACDVRAYLATGHPRHRAGDPVFVRGHLRGCRDGADVPLASEAVTLRAGDASTLVRTDRDGNFLAALPASPELVATVRGHDHVRPLVLDEHPRAEVPLRVRFDRAGVAPGERFTVTVSDDRGGYPEVARVRLEGKDIAAEGLVGPGCPATFEVRAPRLAHPLTLLHLRAVASLDALDVEAVGSLWTGAASVDAPVVPAPAAVAPVDPDGLTLRAPPTGATWFTLERRDVWSSRLLRAGEAASFTAPADARGAVVVSTHLHAGVVTRTERALGGGRPFALSIASDRRAYRGGETARVTLEARATDGAPRDAVATVWLADLGWWDEEDVSEDVPHARWWGQADDPYPSPDEWFRRPPESAGAGDSSAPDAFGGEEGRHFAPVLRWNDRPLPRATFRHLWASVAEPLTFDVTGDFGYLARRLAQAAGFARAVVCPSAQRRIGTARLEVREVPWTIAANRVAAQTGTVVRRERDALRFDCPDPRDEGTIGMGNIGTMGHGSGTGGGQGYGAQARIVARAREASRVAVGLLRLGPTGRATASVRMPASPGRWRLEALAIADDGAGGRTHAVVTTRGR